MPNGHFDTNAKDDVGVFQEADLESDPELEYYLKIPPHPKTRRRSSSLPNEEMCAYVGNMFNTLQRERQKSTVRKRVKKLLKRQKQKPAFITHDQTVVSRDRHPKPKFSSQSTKVTSPNIVVKSVEDEQEIEDESEGESAPLEHPSTPTSQSKKGYWRRNKDGSSFFIGSGSESEIELKDYKIKKQHRQSEETVRRHLIRASSISSHDSDEEQLMGAKQADVDIYRFQQELEASSDSSDSGEDALLLQREQPEVQDEDTTKAKWEKIKTFIVSGFDSLKKDEQKHNYIPDHKLSGSLPDNVWPSPITTRRVISRRRSSSLSSLTSMDNQPEQKEEEEKKPNIFTLALTMIKKSRSSL